MSEAEKRIREALSVASIEPRDECFKVDTDDLTALLADHAEREAALRAEVERLKAAIDTQPSPPTREDMEWAGKVHLAKAEKENDALRAEVEALRAALKPFVHADSEYAATGMHTVAVNGRDLIAARAALEGLRPCRSPYCECEQGKCTHPGCYDARG